jgi:hypothetical protein
MNDDTVRSRTNETQGHAQGTVPPPATEEESVRRDTTYSPGSDTETRELQRERMPDTVDDDIDAADVNAVPGTGGPDDVGDVDVDPADLNLPWREG